MILFKKYRFLKSNKLRYSAFVFRYSKFIQITVLLLTIILFSGCQPKKKHNSPNIIIILADDMGYSVIGCFGSEIPTPNIDYLANHGFVLTQFYNSARCCPTRPGRIKPYLDTEHYAHIIDILPTCMEAAAIESNIKNDFQVEGISLVPLFYQKEFNKERAIYWEHQGNWAVRKGDWKLLFTKNINRKEVHLLELFNLKNDRSECIDLSDQYREKIKELEDINNKLTDKVGVEPWASLILARNL